jgi:hypothetical protein
MVTVDRINSDYSVLYDSALAKWLGLCNKCGGGDAAANADLDTVMQAVITLLEAGVGGSIYLKEGQVGTLTYGATILIIEDYHGHRTYYRNNQKLREVGDCPVVASGTHTHTNDTSEQTVVELTPSVVTKLHNLYLDVNALTQAFTIKVYSKVDGTNYREIKSMRLENATAADGPAFCLKEQMVNTAWKITLTSLVAEGASRGVPYRYFTEVWG